MGRPARMLALAGALAALCACGGKAARQTDDGDSGAAPGESLTPSNVATDDGSAPAAPGQAPRQLTPEQDSIQEARLYEQRRQSMETYDSCMKKAAAVDGEARRTIEAACARSRH